MDDKDINIIKNIISKSIQENNERERAQILKDLGDRFMSLRMDIASDFDGKLNENRRILFYTLRTFTKELQDSEEKIKDDMESISIQSVHKVVNGSLMKMNDKLNLLSNQNDNMIAMIKTRTLWGAFQSNIKIRPIKTLSILFVMISSIFLTIMNSFHITNFDGKDIATLIKYIFGTVF